MPNDAVIRVENLSKQYRIGGARTGYKTFRETLVDAAKAPFQRLRSAFGSITNQTNEPNQTNETNYIWALDDVSLEVKRGEVVGIIGRNGAGKSTLLKILSKITEPTKGRVELRGRVGSLLEVGTGFHPELTGHENVYMYGAILGMDRWEVTRKFDEIVSFAGIEKFIETPVKRYSSGMYMRLAFAVAAHMEPEILLVDEVLAVGDAAFQKKCLGKMEDVAQGGRTVLFVSHNMAAVGTLCSRCVVLDEGGVTFDGKSGPAIEYYFNQIEKYSRLKLSERRDRGGSGICRFTSLTFEDEEGRSLEVIRAGQAVRIVLEYESKVNEPLYAVKVGVHISHSMFGQVLYFDNRISGDLSDSIPSSGKLVCSIKSLCLMPGSYSITPSLKVRSEFFDYVYDAVVFKVVEDDFYGTGELPARGLFLLSDYSWEMKSK